MISGRRIFFLPSPCPLSFFRPRTYCKGYYYYSPQSSTVIKSKIAATTTLRKRTRFRPSKIRLQCRLFSASLQTVCLAARAYLNRQKYGLFYSLHMTALTSRYQWVVWHFTLLCTLASKQIQYKSI